MRISKVGGEFGGNVFVECAGVSDRCDMGEANRQDGIPEDGCPCGFGITSGNVEEVECEILGEGVPYNTLGLIASTAIDAELLIYIGTFVSEAIFDRMSNERGSFRAAKAFTALFFAWYEGWPSRNRIRADTSVLSLNSAKVEHVVGKVGGSVVLSCKPT
jgi:hypothetical protein